MRGLLSIRDLDRPAIDLLLSRARGIATDLTALTGSVVGLFFYDDSLRTRVGFEVAAARLGARTFSVLGARHTAVMSEPESIDDAVRSVADWCDAICLRHRDATAAARLTGLVDCPIINCGNGIDEHPTQTLIDLLAIGEFAGRIDGVRIALIGDLSGMRAAHSLISGLGFYRGVHVRCVAPAGLEIPQRYVEHYLTGDNTIEHRDDVDLRDVDLVYVAGMPRHTKVPVSDTTRAAFWITDDRVEALGPDVRIMCPLPRVDEIQPEVDSMPNAGYFEQSGFGLPMRMAILEQVLRPQCQTTRSGS